MPDKKILLIKTSSMGDVIHNLPVASDIRRAFPRAQIDWLVEESFADIPKLHPAVTNVITVAIRRWRGRWFGREARREREAFVAALQGTQYDHIIDTQGLLKSAWLARATCGRRCGYAFKSAREPLASWFYDDTYRVEKNLHAVERNRQLAAQCLAYALTEQADYGIRAPDTALNSALAWLHDAPAPTAEVGASKNGYAVLLHATSRADKLWAENRWIELANALDQRGLGSILVWGSEAEKNRSERLAAQIPGAVVAPQLSLQHAAALLARARVAIGVDTGLSHLAAALKIPVVGIYCATDPGLTGIYPAAGAAGVNLGSAGHPPTVAEVMAAIENIKTSKIILDGLHSSP